MAACSAYCLDKGFRKALKYIKEPVRVLKEQQERDRPILQKEGQTDSLSACSTVDGPRTRRGRSLRHSCSKEPEDHRGNICHDTNKIRQLARKGEKKGLTVVLMPGIMSETTTVISDNNSQ
jgi:hypothetical protein